MGETYTQARTLRSLADALDRQREANTVPGITAPSQILFADHQGQPLEGYGNNPTLLKAMATEIRISWNELRVRALTRLDDSVEQLSEQARTALAQTDARRTEG